MSAHSTQIYAFGNPSALTDSVMPCFPHTLHGLSVWINNAAPLW